jgi:hypothetical protein
MIKGDSCDFDTAASRDSLTTRRSFTVWITVKMRWRPSMRRGMTWLSANWTVQTGASAVTLKKRK